MTGDDRCVLLLLLSSTQHRALFDVVTQQLRTNTSEQQSIMSKARASKARKGSKSQDVTGEHTSTMPSSQERYSKPNQAERFAAAKKEKNERYLDITTVYDGSFLNGKRVAVTGANRGLGLALATEAAEQGAKVVGLCRSGSKELDALNPDEVVTGVDVTDDNLCESLPDKIQGGPIDIVSVLCTILLLKMDAGCSLTPNKNQNLNSPISTLSFSLSLSTTPDILQMKILHR